MKHNVAAQHSLSRIPLSRSSLLRLSRCSCSPALPSPSSASRATLAPYPVTPGRPSYSSKICVQMSYNFEVSIPNKLAHRQGTPPCAAASPAPTAAEAVAAAPSAVASPPCGKSMTFPARYTAAQAMSLGAHVQAWICSQRVVHEVPG